MEVRERNVEEVQPVVTAVAEVKYSRVRGKTPIKWIKWIIYSPVNGIVTRWRIQNYSRKAARVFTKPFGWRVTTLKVTRRPLVHTISEKASSLADQPLWRSHIAQKTLCDRIKHRFITGQSFDIIVFDLFLQLFRRFTSSLPLFMPGKAGHNFVPTSCGYLRVYIFVHINQSVE